MRLTELGLPAVVSELIAKAGMMPLDGTRADVKLGEQLGLCAHQPSLKTDRKPSSKASNHACLAGLWLRLNFLDESHVLSQQHESNQDNNYWHAIMHRREGDFWNSKYWNRRVGNHPITRALGMQVTDLFDSKVASSEFTNANADASLISELRQLSLPTGDWSADGFVDAVELATTKRSDWVPLCEEIQQIEWNVLFAWCWQKAYGTP